MDKTKIGLILAMFLILIGSVIAQDNATLLYGHNGSDWIPLLTEADGTLKTDMDLTDHDSDIIPALDNTYNIGTVVLRWLKGFFVNLFVSGNLNVTGNSYAGSFIGNIIGFHEENITVTVSGGIGSNSSINCCDNNTILQIAAFPTSATNSYFFNVTSVNIVEVIQSNNSLNHTGNWLATYRTTADGVISYNISGATIDEDFTIRTRWKR